MPVAAASSVTSPRQKAGVARNVLIDGQWRPSRSVESFTAADPRTGKALPEAYPVSCWSDIDIALGAAANAAAALRAMPDAAQRIAFFLADYADRIDASAQALVAAASIETALPASPRLSQVELPRTTGQLRQAAAAVREGSWCRPTIDTKAGIRSCLAPLGPVWVIGPNNFPFAFNAISGGEFAAAIASGNPVIAKGHPLHPATTRLLAEAAHEAATAAQLPGGTVQMLYHMAPADGLRLVGDSRLQAVAFTGSRPAGLRLKAAADAAGKLFFGEMSSINPTVILPGALAENCDDIAGQLTTSVLMGTGQFCTKPGLFFVIAGPDTEKFIDSAAARFNAAPAGYLFSESGSAALKSAVRTLQAAGADLIAGTTPGTGPGFGFPNTLLRVPAKRFLGNPEGFQTEAFGNAALIVVADDSRQLLAMLNTLGGNLTGSIYSSSNSLDDALCSEVAAILRPKVGRLLNDKMATGVAVSPAMNHGGPFPATNHPHFTAVGMPAAILRFTQLESYDNVREYRLPPSLRDKNPTGTMWRMIDGQPSTADVQRR
jgi:NADP-dependent aldehyde dehydrogenase